MKNKILILLIICINYIKSDHQYLVPSYFGYFNKNYFEYNNLTQEKLVYFEIHDAIDIDSNNQTIYFTNSNNHCIYSITNRVTKLLAGTPNVNGNRNGNIKNNIFNSPSGLVFYHYNDTSRSSEINMKLYLTINKTCSINDTNCLFTNTQPNLTINNLRFYPTIIQFPEFTQSDSYHSYLYVTDTLNHCIKQIDLMTRSTNTIAGICGTSGFLDGPLGFNLLNKPTSIGITRKGVIYFFDKGNEYIRKIENKTVYTMLNGACIDYGQSRMINNKFQIRNILCYQNWIQNITNTYVNHVLNPNDVNICTDQYRYCENLV